VPSKKDSEVFATLREALEFRNNEHLQKLLNLLPNKERPTRKAELVALIEKELAGENLQGLYERLEELQQKAVSEAAWDKAGIFRADRFKAKYGGLPVFAIEKDRRNFGDYYGSPTLLCLFLFSADRYNNPWLGWIVPKDLQQRLQSFVPRPSAITLNTADELPEFVEREEKEWELAEDDPGITIIRGNQAYVMPRKEPKVTKTIHRVPLNRRDTERDAAQEMPTILRLIDKGKIAVSDKTFQPSSLTEEEIAVILRNGDFYERQPKRKKSDQEIGPIKAFAWPMLLQAAKLAELSGKKLALTKPGRAALSAQPAEILRTIWQRWLKTRLFDEFNRIEIVKGKSGRGGRNITAVESSRAVLAEALKQCPAGEWVQIDDFFRYLKAAAFDFEVARESIYLYVEDQQYGHLGGYGRQTEWLMLQGRYTMCFLFEYVATLGMIDVAYTDPVKARKDFRELWGVDDLDYFSRYDGLTYFRLNPLGAYCLGLADQYTPQQIEARARLTVLPSLRVNVSGGALSLDEAMLLETWADRESDDVWHLSQERALKAIETGGQISELREFLKAREEQELPETVVGFITTTERRARACVNRGAALLIECTDAAIADQIATHERMKKLCLRAGEKHLVVMSDAEESFRKALRSLGYGMPRA
jgi:hypothetical protein